MLMCLSPPHPQPGCYDPALVPARAGFSAHWAGVEDFGQVTINAECSGKNWGVPLGALAGSSWDSSALPAVVWLQGEGEGRNQAEQVGSCPAPVLCVCPGSAAAAPVLSTQRWAHHSSKSLPPKDKTVITVCSVASFHANHFYIHKGTY